MKAVHIISFILLVVGGLNWGVVGIWEVDLVAKLGPSVAQVVYILVGIAAIVELLTHKKSCKPCASQM